MFERVEVLESERRARGHDNRGREDAPPRDRCLLYTSDAADERSSVDLGGRRIIKKKKRKETDGGRKKKMKYQMNSCICKISEEK